MRKSLLLSLISTLVATPTWAADEICITALHGSHQSRSPLDLAAHEAGLTLKTESDASAYAHTIGFYATDGSIAGYAKLKRLSGPTAIIEEIKLPNFSGLAKNIDAEKFLKETVQALYKQADKFHYSEVVIAPFQKWARGNVAFQSTGFKLDESSGLYRRKINAVARADRLNSRREKIGYFDELAAALEKKKTEIEGILAEINTDPGTAFEFEQALDAVRNLKNIELHNLESSRKLNNVAIYASTNVPLYTLVVHGFIPASIAKNVWFRTPERTRAVYKKLLDTIQNELAPDALAGLHLLTESKDVQYDSFRNAYVLGVNSNGNFVREPAEIVLFTGSPDTAKKIQEQIRSKAGDLENKKPFKQVFLGYGAGMNPMIVTASAKDNLDRAVNATIENISINCAQDCSVPKLYLVHEKVAAVYQRQLLAKITALSSEPQKPLTMTKDFERLVTYRQKYAKYLVNQNAVLNPQTKIVTPHVFVFPAGMLPTVELQEHFAPIIPIFIYKDEDDLLSAARDERLQKQAMFAQVFGSDHATEEMKNAKLTFQEQGHIVWTNRNLFSMESANMPFGGAGTETSIVSVITKNPNESAVITRGHYPTLFSQEAAQHFSKPAAESAAGLQPPEFYQKQLAQALAKIFEGSKPYFPARGIKAIQEEASRNGMWQTYSFDKPASKKALRKEEYWYGTKLVFRDDSRKGPVHKKGVMLHPAEMGMGVSIFKTARGDFNPQEGVGNLLEQLHDNKLLEYYTTEAIWPGIMPRTETLGHLRNLNLVSDEFELKRRRLFENINAFLMRKLELSESERKALRDQARQFVAHVFKETRTQFPEGAYFKNFGEFATGDLGNQVTTFSASYKHIADEFLRRIEAVQFAAKSPISLTDARIGEFINKSNFEMGTAFVHRLLTNPDKILVQERVLIAKTELGFPKEVRVDFIDGEVVVARPRFSPEYQPELLEKASQVVAEFFAKAPDEFRYLPGGADVAELADGSMVIIEFNYGTASGTLEPGFYPVEAHQFISILQNHDTDFLKWLEHAYQAGLPGQRKLLTSLAYERSVWMRQGPEDLSVEDVGRYFRDRLLDDWTKNGAHAAEAYAVERHLEDLFEGFTSDPIARLKESARHYIRRTQR